MIGAVLLWICAVCVSTQAEYLGCYHSNVTSSWHGSFYDIDNCTEVCQFNFSSTLAAVQNGTQCFCGEGLLFQEEEACDVHVFAVCPIGRFNAPGTHNCDATCHCNGTCSYLGGACDKCMLGWIGDACEFRDCEIDNGGCEQQCVPQQKTAWCSCFDGYRSVDAGRCEDNDECASEPCEWRCTNQPGSYSCSCPAGYSLDSDRSSCLDENECETDELERCHLCVNIPGNYTCTCHHGYQLLNDMKTCEDLDECVDSDSCQHTCINSPGSFQCHCFDGYAKVSPSSCADIDECASDNGGCQHSCINYGGGYSCQCHHGYSLVGSKRCSDVDECVVSPCGQLCLNTIGGYECACDTGYLLTSDGTNCTPCAPGWFGVNCSRKCHCKDHRSCNIVNGTCPTVGCSAGFRGASCSEPFIAPHEESFHPATVALTVLIVMMLVAMALSGMILFLKYRGSSYAMPRMIIESRASFRNSHHSIIDTAMLRVKENKPIQININEMNRDSGDSKTSGMSLANDDDDKAALTKSVERIDISLLSLETCSEKYSSTFIPNEEFVHRGSSLWEDQLLIQEEFLNIPMKVHECYEVPKDLKKNRFKDIKPYKHNRVVLIDVEQNDPYGDYINASYIVGYALMDQFISAQGPRPNTVADFLCMLWEQGASCVVMLTREVEGGKRKCTNYWYKLHESKSYGIYTVEVIDEEKWLDFTIRKLKLQKAGSGSRIVTQFHFMSWPDYGCPEVSALLRLHKKVAVESRKGGVIVVHCSAGVGRSGTYIALNWLIHQSETEGGVDIPACVNRLRQSRVNMVQTVDQYAFLYRAMHQVLNLGETSAPIQSFSALSSQAQEFNITTGHTEIEKQYMFLEQHLHAPKVRTPSSPDKPPMSPLLPDSPDSLKAVYIDSIKCQDEYIAAEWPSAFTIDSFWKIVAHTKVQNVIVLQEDGWMPPVSLLDSPFVSINSTETLPDLFLHTISLERQTPEPDNHLTVKVIHLHKIPHTTGNRLPLNLVVSALRRMYDDKERRKSKCLVMCADGAFHTGQFLVITALMDMISLMNEADVFYVVGMMKAKNPEFVSSLAQYQHMYEVVDSICQQLSSTPPSFNVQ